MIDDPDGIAAVLAGTPLAGLPVSAARDGCLVVGGVSPAEVLPAWRVARSLMPLTGRRPVFRAEEGRHRVRELGTPVDPAPALTSEAFELDPDDLPLFLPGSVSVADLPDRSWTEDSLNRWIYDRVVADPALLAEAEERSGYLVGTRYWYEPRSVSLCLMPTGSPSRIAARLDFFGTVGEPELLAAVLEHWHRTYGAELVAEWGTMLQFVVGRRPVLGDEAWELAGEHKALATHQDADRWLLAVALARSDTWFLHSRP